MPVDSSLLYALAIVGLVVAVLRLVLEIIKLAK